MICCHCHFILYSSKLINPTQTPTTILSQHAAWLVTQAIEKVTQGANYTEPSIWSAESADPKINRSYGSTSRGTNVAEQDHHTGAITEVLCTMTTPLLRQKAKDWVNAVNEELKCIMDELSISRVASDGSTKKKWSAGHIKVFGRVHIPNKRFNAEVDAVRRSVDYCFPADMLLPESGHGEISRTAFLESLESFPPGNKSYRVIEMSRSSEPTVEGTESSNSRSFFFKNDTMPSFSRPNDYTLKYLSRLKKLMQSFQTQVEELDVKDKGAMLEKSMNESKRKSQKAPKKKRSKVNDEDKCQEQNEESGVLGETDSVNGENDSETPSDDEKINDANAEAKGTIKRLLRRKRYHNFSPNILAHDYLAYRRVDRFYHRGTIRLNEDSSPNSEIETCLSVSQKTIQNRPFFIFSLKGDILLHQQVSRVMGLLIAICRGVIDEDILECIFDEEYTNLVPAPPAPSIGLLAGEVSYITWEGRLKTILSARRSDRFPKGWNDEEVIQAVKDWETSIIKHVAKVRSVSMLLLVRLLL